MGPFFPTITLTDPAGSMTRVLVNFRDNCPLFDGDAPGEMGYAMTHRGRLVDVWKPAPEVPMNMKYFCHGLTLGTYRKYGYTVFSGLDILKALEDDCVEIGAGQTLMAMMKLLNAGDIISFTNLQGNIIHTALVVDLHNAPQMLTENEIYYEVDLLTKNGVLAECLQSLLVVRGVYSRAPTMRYWRIR